ncbi:MAG: hypothetical protein RDV48_24370 [Candidatus Eremiobacteraeota bacterium]|nr:hypothetical protein [Candidatus Eremiobacteraeota bacterium]
MSDREDYCGACGEPLDEGETFCGACGEKASGEGSDGKVRSVQGRKGKPDSSKIILTGLVIILAALVMMLVFPKMLHSPGMTPHPSATVDSGVPSGPSLELQLVPLDDPVTRQKKDLTEDDIKASMVILMKRLASEGYKAQIIKSGEDVLSISFLEETEADAIRRLVLQRGVMEIKEERLDPVTKKMGWFTALDRSCLVEEGGAEVIPQGAPGGPGLSLVMNPGGTKRLEECTKNNKGKPLGLFIDGKLIAAPFVGDVITSGRFVIGGITDEAECRRIVSALNSGTLPVGVKMMKLKPVSGTKTEAPMGRIKAKLGPGESGSAVVSDLGEKGYKAVLHEGRQTAVKAYVVRGSFRKELAKPVREYLEANNYKVKEAPLREGWISLEAGGLFPAREDAEKTRKKIKEDLDIELKVEPQQGSAEEDEAFVEIEGVDEKGLEQIKDSFKGRITETEWLQKP